jgi:spore germination cell wall hydrolase CwlJ-like protein
MLTIALTLAGEGIGEPWAGKVWIADTIYNYAQIRHVSAAQSCLMRKPNRYACWDAPSELVAKKRKFEATGFAWRDCLILAKMLNDGTYIPMSTSTHYLNPKTVKRVPSWKSKFRFVATIGNHDFYSER